MIQLEMFMIESALVFNIALISTQKTTQELTRIFLHTFFVRGKKFMHFRQIKLLRERET